MPPYRLIYLNALFIFGGGVVKRIKEPEVLEEVFGGGVSLGEALMF